MLSSYEGDDEFKDKAKALHPGETGGNTSTSYVLLSDVDGHSDRARAAGAETIMEPKDQGQGGRSYAARDPEGYVWSFGSYDPWATP